MRWTRKIYDLESHLHFITFSCNHRRKLLNQDHCKRIVIAHLEKLRKQFNSKCCGFVIMPDHVHALIGFPEVGSLSRFMQEWKRQTSLSITEHFQRTSNPILEYLKSGNEGYRVWQPKYYGLNIFTQKKFTEKLNYMHNNPVFRELAQSPEEWHFSSACWYISQKPVGVKISLPNYWTMSTG